MLALQRLNLEDYVMETVPRYLQDVNPRHLLLDCSLSLLASIAAGKSSPEWHKFSHIQQVKAYADDEGSPRKWYVLYTREPFCFETNISRSAIAQGASSDIFLFPDTVFGLVCFLGSLVSIPIYVSCAARSRRTWFPYNKICPIEEEWLVERRTRLLLASILTISPTVSLISSWSSITYLGYPPAGGWPMLT
jgi:hypothetical protein